MLPELLLSLTADCPPPARALGLHREAAAIWARHRRWKSAWAPHLQSSRNAILEAVTASVKNPRDSACLVLGSGLLLDVPLQELAGQFKEIQLLDICHLLPARVQARRHANVRLITADVTTLAAPLSGMSAPDFILSANLLSQLPLPLTAQLRSQGASPEEITRQAQALISAHLDLLRHSGCPALLITDLRRQLYSRDGAVLSEESALFGLETTLPAPLASWWWDIAPPGEITRREGWRHQVGVFRFAAEPQHLEAKTD